MVLSSDTSFRISKMEDGKCEHVLFSFFYHPSEFHVLQGDLDVLKAPDD